MSSKRLSILPQTLWKHFRSPSSASSASTASDSSARFGAEHLSGIKDLSIEDASSEPERATPEVLPATIEVFESPDIEVAFESPDIDLGLLSGTVNIVEPVTVDVRQESYPVEQIALGKPQPANSLRVLPEDILLLILSLLEPADLLACERVCLDMHRRIQSDVNLKYRLDLATSGMVDGPSDGTSVEEKLRMLRDYVSRSRVSAEAITRETRHIGSATQILVSGDTVVYCTCVKGRSEIEILSPSSVGSDDPLSRIIVALPYAAHVEAIDMSQDLLVISKMSTGVFGRSCVRGVKPRLLSARTGSRHPDAFKPSVNYPNNETSEFADVQIHGRLVAWAAMLEDGGVAVEVRDWKTGQLLWRRQFSDSFHQKVHYALFDEDYLLATTSSAGDELGIYHISTPSDGETTSKDEPATPVLVMLAPSGVSFGAVQGNRQSNLIPGAPFRPDPLTKIFAVRFSQGGDSKQGTVLVPHYLIYDYLEHARGRPGYRVDWCNWGQYETLVINTTGVIFDPASPPIPYGSRFPLLMTERGFELCGRVVVFDLNPTLAEAARRGMRREGDRSPVPLEVLEGLMCPPPLRSNTPYMAVRGQRLFFRNQHRLVDCGGPLLLTP